MDVSATGIAGSAGAGSADSLQQLGEDYTKFLTLLTAQIENQDPLSPMDSTQFVSQLAQLSQVEQAVKTNSNLEAMFYQNASLMAVTGAEMIGREVTIASDRIDQIGATNDGFYRLMADAQSVEIEIRDPLGIVVRTLTGLSGTADEDIPISWDGLSDSGQTMPDGEYTITLRASDVQGNPVTAFTYNRSQVDQVLFDQGNVYYELQNGEVITAGAALAIR